MAFPSHPNSTPFIASARHAVVTTLQTIGSILAGFNHALMVNSAAGKKLELVERLQAKTDAELAEMGIKRDRIVHHVFGDIY